MNGFTDIQKEILDGCLLGQNGKPENAQFSLKNDLFWN
jgi:hypothetical protein